MEKKIFLLQGQVQYYDWGGYYFIPSWLEIENRDHRHFAEYWMGAHVSAPARILPAGIDLNEAIAKAATFYLGDHVAKQFKSLPYLFKLLDVNKMLSIQVHPSKDAAEKGFDEEELGGIGLKAPTRNFRDRNHKPEVMVALSEFWLLHGFMEETLLIQKLSSVKSLHRLIDVFREKGYRGLFEYVMYLEEAVSDTLLGPIVNHAMKLHLENRLDKSQPEFWIAKWYAGRGVPSSKLDKGIFSLYFLNLVHLLPGEAIFQSEGVPHAYLEGQNVELMANSDNVLRAGFTSKHIDVPSLIKHTLFEPITPAVMTGEKLSDQEILYACPVPEFSLSAVTLVNNEWKHSSDSFETFLVLEGAVKFQGSNEIEARKGEVVGVVANEVFSVHASGRARLFRAFTPKYASP